MDSQTGSETPSSDPMPRAAKVGHKKSRLGCKRCKTRRVKCDEQKPVCGSCKRHGAECIYVEVRRNHSPREPSEHSQTRRPSRIINMQTRKSPSPMAELFPRNLTEGEDPEIPESKARRLMELRLMQNSLLNMISGTADGIEVGDYWVHLWRRMVRQLCLEHDNVLYALFAMSATHLLRSNHDDDALYSARQNYFVLALREQRKECANITAENADAVCLASVMILRNSFALLLERSLEPYTPPMEWLKMGRGAGAVLWKANAAVQPNVPSSFQVFLDSYSLIMAEPALDRELDDPFLKVWTAIYEARSSEEDRIAYRKSLGFINTMQEALDSEQSRFGVCRKFQAFPMVIPSRFTDLCEEQDDYALLVLAYYFGIAAQIDQDFWWLKGAPQADGRGTESRTAVREIRAINSHISESVRELMLWPLMKAELRTS